MLPNCKFQNPIVHSQRNNDDQLINIITDFSSLASASLHKENIASLSSFDKMLLTAQKAEIVDANGFVLEDIKIKYPLKDLNEEELESFKALLTETVYQTFSIAPQENVKLTQVIPSEMVTLEFTLLDYFQYLITEAEKKQIQITSINLIGGKVPEILKSYYIRTMNDLYKNRCLELSLDPVKEGLIPSEVASTLDRKAPDIDMVSTIQADSLAILNEFKVDVIERWLPKTCGNLVEARKKLILDYQHRAKSKKALTQPLDREIELGISTVALAFINNLGVRYFANKLGQKHGNLDEKSLIIRRHYYHQFCTINAPGSNPFAMVSFGPGHRLVDSTTVYEGSKKGFYSHHGMSVKLLALINHLDQQKNVNKKAIRPQPFFSKEMLIGGWQSLFDRATRTLRIEGQVEDLNDRSWFPWIYNKCIGYSISDQHMQEKLYRKIAYPILPHLKKHWNNHLTPEYLPFLCFNAIVSLPENVEREENIQAWRAEIMSWSPVNISDLQSEKKSSNELEFPFLHCLKKALSEQSILFDNCRDMLQVHGFLLQSSPQPEYPTSDLKAHISNPNEKWHEVCIFQNNDSKTYAISMPLNLSEAIAKLLKSEVGELDRLEELVKPLCPKNAYSKELIPSTMITDQVADLALLCLDHPHKVLKNLGFELLLLYALAHPKPWILKSLVKSFPSVLESMDRAKLPRLMANLENALNGFPDEIGTKNLTDSIMGFCRSKKSTSKDASLEFCHVMVSTRDPDLIHAAVCFHLTHEKIALDERTKFIQTLLSIDVSEATKLFLKLQKRNCFSVEEEFKIFTEISDVMKKNRDSHIYHAQLLSLSDCVDQLVQRDKNRAREAALIIGQASFDQKHMDDARSWMKRILLLTMKSGSFTSESEEMEKLFFVSQNKYFNLMSIQLPPKATEALNMLLNLKDGELKLFVQLFEQEPQVSSILPASQVGKAEASSLKEMAKKFLVHKEDLFQKIGFELLMVHMKAVPSTDKDMQIINKETQESVDGRLFALISCLPFILTSVKQEIHAVLLNGMKDLLPPSYEKYLLTISAACSQSYQLKEVPAGNSNSKAKPKALPEKENSKTALLQMSPIQKTAYQANCHALASATKSDELIKKLVSLNYIKRGLGRDCAEYDQIEIAFATIKVLLPGAFLSVLEILDLLEKENNSFKGLAKQSIFGVEKKGFFNDIIELLIEKNDLKNAMAQLLKCLKNNTFSKDEEKATELWLNLCNKDLSFSLLCPMAIAEAWISLRQQGGFLNKHHSERQVDLILLLIQSLYVLKNQSADLLANELKDSLKSFTLTEAQNSKLLLVIVEDLNRSETLNLPKLKRSYQVLKEASSSWSTDVNIDFIALILFWLKASKMEVGNLQEESIDLLANAMKILEVSSSDDKSTKIREMSPFIIAALQTEIMKGATYKGFKDQIFSMHSLIVHSLQESSYGDLFFEYLQALHQHHLLEKIPRNGFNQSLWIADEILNKYPNNSEKLQIIHNLAQVSLPKTNEGPIPIDPDKALIPMKLAKALIFHQLHDCAKDWIKLTIEIQKCKLVGSLSEDLMAWCEIFLNREDSLFCLMLFTALSTSPNVITLEMKEDLCLKLSQTFLKKHPLIVQQMVETTFLVPVQENVKNKIWDEGALDREFKMIEMLLKSNDQELQRCGVSMISNLSIRKEKVKDTVYEEVSLDREFKMIEILLKCTDHVLQRRGVSMLSQQLTGMVPIYPLKDPKKWIELCDHSFKIWVDLHAGKQLIFPLEIQTLIEQQSILLKQVPNLIKSHLEKNLELFILRKYCSEGLKEDDANNERYQQNVFKYCGDREWMKKSIKIIVDGLIEKTLVINNIESYFTPWYVFFSTSFLDIPRLFRQFHIELVKIIMDKKLQNEIGTQMILAGGISIKKVLEQYIKDDSNLKGLPLDSWVEREKTDFNELLSTIEEFLLFCPVKIIYTKKAKDKLSALYLNIVQALEKLNYDKFYPVYAISFQLLAIHQAKLSIYEKNPLTPLSKENKDKLKTLSQGTLSDHFMSLNKIVKLLISNNNDQSYQKALRIMLEVPSQIWNNYYDSMLELIYNLINSECLIPDYFDIIRSLIFCSKVNHKAESIQTLTKLCIGFYKKIQLDFNVLDGKTFLGAQSFLKKCLENNIFDKENKIFIEFFEFQLDWYLNDKFEPVQFVLLHDFIKLSFKKHFVGNKKDRLLDIISNKIEKIIVSGEESMGSNVNIFKTLKDNGYFTNSHRNFVHMGQVIFEQFSKYIRTDDTVQKTCIGLMHSLFIISHFDKTKNWKHSFYSLFSENINKIMNEDVKCFEDNNYVFEFLQGTAYYKGRKEEFKKARILIDNQKNILKK